MAAAASVAFRAAHVRYARTEPVHPPSTSSVTRPIAASAAAPVGRISPVATGPVGTRNQHRGAACRPGGSAHPMAGSPSATMSAAVEIVTLGRAAPIAACRRRSAPVAGDHRPHDLQARATRSRAAVAVWPVARRASSAPTPTSARWPTPGSERPQAGCTPGARGSGGASPP
jgi:hypothetical protein